MGSTDARHTFGSVWELSRLAVRPPTCPSGVSRLTHVMPRPGAATSAQLPTVNQFLQEPAIWSASGLLTPPIGSSSRTCPPGTLNGNARLMLSLRAAS